MESAGTGLDDMNHLSVNFLAGHFLNIVKHGHYSVCYFVRVD